MQNVHKRKHGWFHHYRRPFLWINGTAFVLLWVFTQPVWPFPGPVFNEVMEGLGYLVLVVGIIGRMYASFTIASHKNARVVKTEMYSIVRHPLYFFSFLIAIGIGLLTERAELLLYMAAFNLTCFYPMIRNEEKYLESKFGPEYAEYKRRVPMLLPNVFKWTAREKIEINLRLVTRTILDGSVALLLFPAVEIMEVIKAWTSV